MRGLFHRGGRRKFLVMVEGGETTTGRSFCLPPTLRPSMFVQKFWQRWTAVCPSVFLRVSLVLAAVIQYVFFDHLVVDVSLLLKLSIHASPRASHERTIRRNNKMCHQVVYGKNPHTKARSENTSRANNGANVRVTETRTQHEWHVNAQTAT